MNSANIIFLCFDLNNYASLTYISNILKDKIFNNQAILVLLGLKCEFNKYIELEIYKEIISMIKDYNLYYAESSIYYADDYIYKEFTFEDININIEYESNPVFTDHMFKHDTIYYRGGVGIIIQYALAKYEAKNLIDNHIDTKSSFEPFKTDVIEFYNKNNKQKCCVCSIY
jgi:hypothetical protein